MSGFVNLPAYKKPFPGSIPSEVDLANPDDAVVSGYDHRTVTLRGTRRNSMTLVAEFVASKNENGDPAEYWRVALPDNGTGNVQPAIFPGRWTPAHTQQLAALANNQPYVPMNPGAETPQQRRDRQLDLLEHGPDATLQVPEFSRYLATSEARTGNAFGQAVNAHENEAWPVFARELFADLYGSPEPVPTEERGAVEWIGALLDKARDSSAWPELQSLTRGEPWSAGVGAAELVSALGLDIQKLLKKAPPEDPQRLEEQAESLQEILGEEHEMVQEAWNQHHKAAGAQHALAQAIREADASAVSDGVHQAVETLSDLGGQIQGLGGGGGPNPLVCSTPTEIREALARSPELRAIAKLAGRLRIASRAAKRNKVTYVPEQIADVTVGSEIARLLPAELVQLADPTGELLLLRKLTESQAQQYELTGTEALQKGPVVMAVDSSGSMSGLRYQWAMGVALALLETCLKERRPFRFFTFDGYPNEVHTVNKPTELTIDKLESMLTEFSGGGTDIKRAMAKAAELVGESTGWKRADIVLVSDGEDGDFSGWIRELKEGGVHTFGVSIGTTFSPEVLAEMSGACAVTDLQLRDGSANMDVVFGL